MKTYLAIALSSLTLVAGWVLGGGNNAVHAQAAMSSASQLCFEIPHEARLDGRPMLLDKCTGDTWRFDDGYEGSAFAGTLEKLRPYSWQSINRD